MIWVVPAELVLLFQEVLPEKMAGHWSVLCNLTFRDILSWYNTTGPEVFQLRSSVSGKSLNKYKPRRDFGGQNYKILI